jgi:polyhydroxybutyrate depolymerase
MADHPRFVKAAGTAGLLAPIAWGAVAAIELAHARVAHSLISRPERLFDDSAWHWPLVLAVVVMVSLLAVACIGLALEMDSPRRRAAVLGAVPALTAFRLLVAIQLPSNPGGYGVSALAALDAWLLLILAPLTLLTVASVVRRRGPGLAWLSAGLAVAMVVTTLWATVWAARSSATEPQLLAVEPVEGLAALWSAAVGAWLLGWPARLRPGLRWPEVPVPGRKSAVAIAFVLVAGVVGASGLYVRSYWPIIAAQLTGRTSVQRISFPASERTYRVYRPAKPADKPGLIVALHGVYGSGLQAESTTGLDAQADRLGWVVAYPDGVADGWDAFGSGPAWGSHPGVDDVDFIRQVIRGLELSDGVDPDRVYVTGHSRGAMMTYRLGCELSDTVSAIAPVSGNMATAGGSADVPCTLTQPVSVLAIHGTADTVIPMAGGRVDIVFSPMADVIARWRSLDSCTEPPSVSVEGIATTTSWTCAGASTVATRILAGGCHCWPDDASRLIADFFVAHPGEQKRHW